MSESAEAREVVVEVGGPVLGIELNRPSRKNSLKPAAVRRIIELLMSIQLPVVCKVRRRAAGLGCQIVALELSSRTSDFREGLKAFTDRRSPAFEGR